MIRILHVIGGLGTGGTELFLERLVQSLGDREFEHHIVSMLDLNPMAERMRRRGTRVDTLYSRRNLGAPLSFFKLGRLLRDVHPDLVQGWMYHGNLAAGVTMRLSGTHCPLLWNIRHSLDQWSREKLLLRGEIRFSRWLAGVPERIIFNSDHSAWQHEQLGYPRTKTCVIPNGFDLERFAPNAAGRSTTRAQLGIGAKDVVLGMIGRYHPLKDHTNFLQAARIVANKNSDTRFIMAGRQVTAENGVLMRLVQDLQLQDRIMLLGERDDIVDLLNAFDIYVSSSASEAFPNVVGEAMCCGIPCLVTETGDSAELVADTGVVVPPKSPERLAAGMLQLIQAGTSRRQVLGAAARERICLNYSNAKVAQQYADLYRSVCKPT